MLIMRRHLSSRKRRGGRGSEGKVSAAFGRQECREGRGGAGEGKGQWKVLEICLCSPWQCVAAMAPLASVHFSECVMYS